MLAATGRAALCTAQQFCQQIEKKLRTVVEAMHVIATVTVTAAAFAGVACWFGV